MFGLKANEIDFTDSSFKKDGVNYKFYVEFSENLQKDIWDGMDTAEFIEYMEDLTEDVKKIKDSLGGKIPYQFFCFLHHSPVLIRKQYFDAFISKFIKDQSGYFNEHHVKKSYNGPEADGIFNFRKELNYIRHYQSACRRFIKQALEESAPYATALYEDVVRTMTEAYKPYYASLDYNFDNLHDGYLTPDELYAKQSSPDFLGFANAWADEHPHLTDAMAGLAASYAITKLLK